MIRHSDNPLYIQIMFQQSLCAQIAEAFGFKVLSLIHIYITLPFSEPYLKIIGRQIAENACPTLHIRQKIFNTHTGLKIPLTAPTRLCAAANTTDSPAISKNDSRYFESTTCFLV